MNRGKFLDLVIAGPDMSGTSTQIKSIVNYFQSKEMFVRDLRGTEVDALFHTEEFQKLLNPSFGKKSDFIHFGQFLKDVERWEKSGVLTVPPESFLNHAYELLSKGETNQDLAVASMVKNDFTTYINPNSADVWIMEEPTKRGAGQVNRVIEQNRSAFGYGIDPFAAALCHQVYRIDEFLRFRKPLRENRNIILRSRSEESACYQIFDKKFLPNGIKLEDYIKLPGHKIAFENSPTNIFVVCAPENWTTADYIEMKKERGQWRRMDDHEANAEYQVLVNKRYASDWIDNLYEKGCKMHGGIPPEITRFSIYDSIDEINNQMNNKLEERLFS